MLIAIKAQRLEYLFLEGRELIIVRPCREGACDSFGARCLKKGLNDKQGNPSLYDVEVTEPFRSGETGTVSLTKDAWCIPVPQDFIKRRLAKADVPLHSLVLVPAEHGLHFFGELLRDDKVFCPGIDESLKVASYSCVDPEKACLDFAEPEDEENHQRVYEVAFARGKTLLVNIDSTVHEQSRGTT